MYRKIFSWIIIAAFIGNSVIPAWAQPVESPGYQQILHGLPGHRQILEITEKFQPPVLRGISVDPENPFRVEFMLDEAEALLSDEEIKQEAERLSKYFLAGLAVPRDELWVNLSPYEADEVVPDELGRTDLGKDLLAEDYVLKQLLASLMHPESEAGKAFWAKVYTRAEALYGTSEIPVETCNKVWVVPKKAVVYENGNEAVITESSLEVLLDEDYLAMSEQGVSGAEGMQSFASEVAREVIVPLLEQEVNEGEHFGVLRQIYHSLILASWYKHRLTESVLSRAYADKKKVEGIELSEAGVKERIYGQYVKAFEEGAYDLVKTEYDLQNGRSVSRRYVSGGVTFGKLGPGNGIVSFIFDRARRVIDAMREKVETTRVRADFLAAGSAPAETDAGLVTAASSAVKMDGGKSDRLMTKVVTEEGVFLPLGVTFEEIIQEIGGLEKKEGKITEENGRIYLKAPHVLTGGIRGKLLYLAEWAKKISGLAPWDMPEKGLHGDTFAGYMIETAHFDELIIYLKEALLGQIVQEFANHILQGITIKKGTIVDNIFPDENGRILSTEKAAIIVSRMQSELKQYGLTPFATRDSDPAVEHFVHFISSRLVESGIGQMQDGLYYLGDLSAVEGSSYFEGNAGPLEIAGLRKIFRYEKRTNVETVGELIQIFNGKGQNLLQRTAQGVLGILTSRLQRSGSAFRELEVLRDHVRKQLTASVDSPDSIAVKISAPWGSRARRIALSLAAAWQESDPDSITISSEEAIQFIGEIDREQDKILGDMVKGVIERVELDEDKKFFLLPLGFPRVVRGENRKTRIERVVELLEVMRSHLEVPGENVPETEIILNKSVMKFFAQELSKVGIGVVEQNVAEQDVYRVKKDDVFAGHAVLKGVIKEFSGFNLTHSASSAVTQDREVFSEQRVVLRPQDSQETYNYSVEEMIKLLTGMKPSEGGLRDVLREKSTGTRSQKVPTSDPALPIWQALAGSLKFVEIKKGMKSRLHDLNLAPAEWVQEEPWIVIYNPGELNEWLSRQIGGFESLSNGQTLKELRKKKGFDLGLFEVKNEFRYTENGFRMPVFQALRELADWEKRLSAEDATLADSDLWKLFREEYPFLPEFLQDKENVSLVSSEILNKLREIVLQRKNVLFPGLAQAFMGVLEMNDDGSITVPNQYAPMALKREPVEIKQALRIMGIINNALSESPITKEEAIAKPGEARDWFIFQDGEDILMPLGGGALIEYFMSAAAERGIGGIVELNSERFYSFKKEDLDVVRDFWREVHYQLQAKSPTASSAVDAEVVLSLGKIWETLKLKANNRELPANVDIADMAEIARQTILSLLSERGNDISYEEEGGEIVSEMDPSEFFVNDLPELLSWFLMTREIVKWYQTAARELDFSLLTEFESVTQSILPVLSEINTGGKLWLERELRVFPESFPAEEVGTFSADVVRDELTAMRDELEESMRRIRKEGEVRGFAIPMISTGYPHLRAGIMSALVDSGVFPEIKLILFFFFGFYFIPFTDGNSLLEWINQRLDDLHGGRLFGEKEELRVRMSPMVSNDSLKPDDAVKALDEIVASLKKAKARQSGNFQDPITIDITPQNTPFLRLAAVMEIGTLVPVLRDGIWSIQPEDAYKAMDLFLDWRNTIAGGRASSAVRVDDVKNFFKQVEKTVISGSPFELKPQGRVRFRKGANSTADYSLERMLEAFDIMIARVEQAREEEKGVIVIPFDLTNMPARDFLEAIAVHKNSSEDQVDFWLEWGERSPDGMFMHWQVDGSLDSLRLWLQDTQAWLKEEQDDRPVPVAELELEKQDSVVFETAGKEKPHNFNAQRLIDLFSGWLRQGLGRDGVLYLFVDDAVGNEDFLKVIGQNSLPLYASWGFEIAKAAEHVDLGGKQVDVWRVSGNLHAFIKWLKLHILYFDKESILEQVSRGEAFPEGYVVSEDAVRHYVHKLQETGSALFETLEEEVVQAELINLWLRVEWSLKILSSDKSDTGLPDLSSLSIDTDTNEIKHSFGLRPLFKESELESLGINPAELVALRSKIIEAKTMSRLEDAYSETTTFVGGLMKSILENPRYIDKVKTQKQNLPDGLTLDTLFGHLFGRWKQVDKVVKEREGFSGKSSSALKNKDSTPRGGMDFARDVLETEGESAASFDMVPLEPEAIRGLRVEVTILERAPAARGSYAQN